MKSAVEARDAIPSPAVTRRAYGIKQYRLPAQVLHWLTAILVVFMVGSGVIAKQLGDGAVSNTLFSLHKLTGAVVLFMIVARLIYRVARSMPPWRDQPRTRPVLHWTLYGVVLLVPLLGWAGISDFGARDVAFGITLPPIWPEGAGYDELLLQWHAYLAFGLLALVAVHIGIAIQDYMTHERPAKD